MKKLVFGLLLFSLLLCPTWVQGDEFKGTPGDTTDDGDQELTGGLVEVIDGCIELMRHPSIPPERWGGAYRFPNVTIPQGATINSAYIQMTAATTYYSAYDSVTCENVDSATVLEDGAGTYDISERWANPTTKILWDDWMRASPQRDSTCDLKDCLQDVINRAGWKSGNAVMFIFRAIREDGVDTAYYEPRTYEADPASHRESLFVDYTAAGGETKKLMWKK